MTNLSTIGWSLGAKLAYSSAEWPDLPGYKGVPCRVWLLSLDKDGYGELWWGGKGEGAHRMAWVDSFGPIPDEQCVCHHCDVRSCVEPTHLFLGTARDNNDDRDSKNRQARGERSNLSTLRDRDIPAICADRRRYREIADQYGISFAAVGFIKRRETWTHVIVDPATIFIGPQQGPSLGERNRHAKLTAKDIPHIRADPRSNPEVALDYGVAHQTISGIRRGHRWKHI